VKNPAQCAKCGLEVVPDSPSCSRCTWPFALGAWAAASRRIHRITLDTTCVNSKAAHSDLNDLERWKFEGRVQLQRSDEMLKELRGANFVAKATQIDAHPQVFILDSSVLDGSDVLGGPDLEVEIREILFPRIHSLTTNQASDVEHLRLHVRTGGDIFLTLNVNDFVTRGRQAKLASFGIWVLTPSEATGLLRKLYRWS